MDRSRLIRLLLAGLLGLGAFYGALFLLLRPETASPLVLREKRRRALAVELHELQALVTALPREGRAHLRYARALLAAASVEAAAEEARRAAALLGTGVEAWELLARCELRRGDLAAAERAARSGLTAAPGAAGPGWLVAESLRRQGKLEAARAEIERVLLAHAENPEALLAAARILQDSHVPVPQVTRLAEAALAAAKDRPEVEAGVGELFIQLDEPERARDLLAAAVERTPEEPRLHHALALALLAREDPSLAGPAEVEALTAISLEPDRPEPYLAVARARILLGRPAEAIGPLQRSVALQPSPAAFHLLAEASARAGRTEQALGWRRLHGELVALFERRDALLTAIRRTPGHPEPYLQLTHAYASVGGTEAAAQVLRDILRHRPHDPSARRALARLAQSNAEHLP